MAVVIDIDTQGSLTGKLARIRGSVYGPRAAKYVGSGLAELWRTHLYRKDNDEPNRLGGKRTHFYSRAADSIFFRVEQGGERVRVTAVQRGLRQRFKGGVIKPKAARMLTIPVHPAAHGKRAREHADLVMIKTGEGRGATLILGKKREGSAMLEAYYVLKPQVTQRADPTVMPHEEQIRLAAHDALRDNLNRAMRTA